jgi:hypothetical protein
MRHSCPPHERDGGFAVARRGSHRSLDRANPTAILRRRLSRTITFQSMQETAGDDGRSTGAKSF